MSLPTEDDTLISRYIEEVKASQGGQYAIKLEQLELILAVGRRITLAQLELLTALQRDVPMSKDHTQLSPRQSHLRDLKDALTNVIIMQTRLNEREKDFLELLKESSKQQVIDAVRVDPTAVEGWAKAILEARRCLG